jgi:uncharacterized protein (UPF0335 family)
MKTLTAEEVAAKHNESVKAKADKAERTAAGSNSQGQLKSYVDRFISLAEQATDIRTDTSELAKEAKGNGFDPAAIKAIVKQQMEDEAKKAKREQRETIIDTYKNALGMLD